MAANTTIRWQLGNAWWAVPAALVLSACLVVVVSEVWRRIQIKPVAAESEPAELQPVGGTVWFDPPPKVDLEAASAHNSRGVELMDNLEFTEARLAFAAAVRAAPAWVPARMNYAIASFNEPSPDSRELDARVENAERVLRNVLRRDPDNRHAHYCLGMIELYFGDSTRAFPHFLKMSQLDPDDPFTRLRVGTTHPDGSDSPSAGECFDKALALDPKLNEARYRLVRMAMADRDEKRTEELLAEYKKLEDADQATHSRIIFGEMGKYADVIGRDPTKPGQPGGDPPGIKKRSPW